MSAIQNALTIDVEDYFQVIAFERIVSRRHWDQFPCRVVECTTRILNWLDRSSVRATFFVLGWIADRFPGLVRDIARAGHEVGSHGYWHRRIHSMTADEFRADLVSSRDVLQQIVGRPVVAFRAPCFSITRQTLWALDVLIEEGFTYDSSIFPVYHDRYGIPDAEPRPHCVVRGGRRISEFPATVLPAAGLNVPVGGGGYFRLLPWSWTRWALRKINDQLNTPFVFYIHPWEFDPDQPRLPGSRWKWRHYVNLASTEPKFARLLDEFSFGTLSEVTDAYFARLHGTASDSVIHLPKPAQELAACA